jgi:sugar lactone lactonase YvrE
MNHRNSALLAAAVLCVLSSSLAAENRPWPPELPGAVDGAVTIESRKFLDVPQSVAAQRGQEGIAPFEMAAEAPKVDFAYHDRLGQDAVSRRLWSSWGDICVASDGRVYCAIGDHGDDAGGDARCFIYRWDPKRKRLEQIVDMHELVPPKPGQPAWSKVHAKIDEGPDGKIYFSCTLNDGNRASKPNFVWNEKLPGGQIYRYDPQTGKAEVFANLPPKRCTATSLLDRRRNFWWCNLEAGEGNALWGLDLSTREPVFQAPDGSMAFNRAFALGRDGSLYFNGEGGIHRLDPKAGKIVPTRSQFAGSPGMRSATEESKQGHIYGTTQSTNQLFRYTPAKDELKMLGPTWAKGEYTTVTMLSPDERFVYYLPGSHGGAFRTATPVVQYEIASGKRKVLAFLQPVLEEQIGYVPAGTYGAKLSADGGTLYVNFNGHAADRLRPEKMKPNGFGLCGFAAIHIPPSER